MSRLSKSQEALTKEKPAITPYPIHELIRQRWSPVAFADRSVEREKLLTLLEAARWAPSSFNEQPWSFIVATREDSRNYEKLLHCLVPGNIEWAKQAPVLMVSVAKLFFDFNKKPNRHAYHDVGMAMANLLLQATALGLSVHQMAGFSVDKAREAFSIPEGYDPVAAMAVGYAGSTEGLSEKLKERELAPRQRKALPEFVFSGKFGEVSPLVEGK